MLRSYFSRINFHIRFLIMYTIYFDNKPFYITLTLTAELKTLAYTHGTLMLNQPNEILVQKALKDIQESAKAVILLTDNVEGNFTLVKNHFVHIQAGGGLVKNELDEYLFIFRQGKWDLPKGKLDPGETIEACALREVSEETGLQNITPGNFLLDTWHVYKGWGQHVLKQSSWFSMQAPSGQQLTPQTEEDIQEIKWLKKEDWHMISNNTFPSIIDVLHH